MNQREPGWGIAVVSSQLPAVFQMGYSFRNEDPRYWAIRGSEQIQIEHVTQQLTMTEDGYFYTYVTNRSTRKMELRQL